MRLKLVPEETDWDFFKYQGLTFGASMVMMVCRWWIFSPWG
jgi:preprotein translocase subunit SecF